MHWTAFWNVTNKARIRLLPIKFGSNLVQLFKIKDNPTWNCRTGVSFFYLQNRGLSPSYPRVLALAGGCCICQRLVTIVVPFPCPYTIPQSIAPRNHSNIDKFTINSPTSLQSYIFNHTHLLHTMKIVIVHVFFLSISKLSHLIRCERGGLERLNPLCCYWPPHPLLPLHWQLCRRPQVPPRCPPPPPSWHLHPLRPALYGIPCSCGGRNYLNLSYTFAIGALRHRGNSPSGCDATPTT